MAIFNFFKAAKVRQFHHEYIYYDPAKEEQEKRLQRVREEIANEKEGKPQRIVRKGFLSEQRKNNKSDAQSRNIRLMLLIVVVAALLMWYMK